MAIGNRAMVEFGRVTPPPSGLFLEQAISIRVFCRLWLTVCSFAHFIYKTVEKVVEKAVVKKRLCEYGT